MKTELIKKLRCPRCLHGDFKLHTEISDTNEVRNGKVTCLNCLQEFSICSGILDALCQADDPIRSEQKGWERFAGIEGWLIPPTQYLLELPRPSTPIPSETLHWDVHADNFEMVMGNLSLEGKDILDVGAGRCWSTKHLALGGANCVAMDILAHSGIGLGVADVLIHHENIFFERVLGDMNNMPFANKSFDIVFFTGALHHSTDLEKTIAECQRVLKPGGMLALTNEACGGIVSNEN
ncbi:MAG: class I SAM-dependent methyltransferase, partial [Bacteroidota bacterium]